MAFFKFRKNGDEQSATPVQPESVEAMRRRAKHRLIGAAVLVLMGVIGFPLLFDKQPRPISVDMPIEIPDRNKVKPLTIPAPLLPAVVATEPVAVPIAKEEVLVPAAPAVVETPQAIPKPEPKAVEQPVLKADESAKAQALLEGREPEKVPSASSGRYVVQIGAFADAARAREARLKVEHAGLKTYTQVAETKDGRRVRVRVGPFATKAEADQAVEKIKKLNLPAVVLTL